MQPEFVWDTYEYSRFAVTFFVAFLTCDTIFGILNYREQFGLVTGWVHHVAYILLFGASIVERLPANTLMTTLPNELSSVVLGLAYVFPRARNDLLFGRVFFAVRVAYHGMLTYNCFSHRHHPSYEYWWWILFVLTLLIHVHWFRGWWLGKHKNHVCTLFQFY